MSPGLADITPAPVAVGGIGGSGTRVLAAILQAAGVFIGADLNEPLDNLWFTLLFKDKDILDLDDAAFARRVHLFAKVMLKQGPLDNQEKLLVQQLCNNDRLQHSAQWLQQRAHSLIEFSSAPGASHREQFRPWGWKEPNTHICVDRLFSCFPAMKYIHLTRDALDMSVSKNQNQLEFWGSYFLDDTIAGPGVRSPRHSLSFWCAMHRRAVALKQKFPDQMLMVGFEELCSDPERIVGEILEFLQLPVIPVPESELVSLVENPAPRSEFLPEHLATYDPRDLQYAREAGLERNQFV